MAVHERSGGSVGNERLTSMVGVVLLCLLAVELATLLRLGQLISVHVFVGMLLIPPIALKLGAVGFRFIRYYAGSPSYRSKGPPQVLMRVFVAPLLVASTLVLFGTGVALVVVGPRSSFVLTLHKASFVLWSGAIGVHVLWYLLRIPGLASADWSRARRIGGWGARIALVVAVLAAGVALATATLPLAHPWLHILRSDH